jgi:hypothetical protein
MNIAASMCIYTNDHILLFSLDGELSASDAASGAASDGAGKLGANGNPRQTSEVE